MTAPRALTRTLSDALTRQLVQLGEQAEARGLKDLVTRISDTIQRGSEPEANAVIERARRQVGDRPVADALSVEETARRMNPNRQGRTTAWDPEVARAGRVRETADKAAQRAASREEKKKLNREEAEALRVAIREAGGDQDRVTALKREYDEKRAARSGGGVRSIMQQAVGEGGGSQNQALKDARSAANKDVNRRLQAKEITPEQAEAEYAAIREKFKATKTRDNATRAAGDLNTRTKVADQRDLESDAYYDTDNPEARDKKQFVRGTGGLQERTIPGGLDQNLVTAASVTRRHIERMIAAGEIPAAPPDAAMPGIIRTAMKELRIPDNGMDDFALMRAYRQQARRASAFSRRRPAETPDAPTGTGDIEMAGAASLEKMTSRLRNRGSMKRQEVEEGFVDDIARELDADEDASELMPSRDLAANVRRAADATVDNDEALEGMSFREMESLRRGRNRAGRLEGQVRRMDEAGAGAAERNMKRRGASASDAPVDRGPRQALIAGDLGKRVFTNKATRTKDELDEAGNVVRRGEFRQSLRQQPATGGRVNRNWRPIEGAEGPAAPWPRQGIGGVPKDQAIDLPPFQGPRQSLGEVGRFRSPFDGVTPDGTPGGIVNPDAQLYGLGELQNAIQSFEGNRSPEAMLRVQNVLEKVWQDVQRLSDESAQPYVERGYDQRARMTGIEDEANQDVDRLVRVLMERVGNMPRGQQDEYFAGSPLDRQLMLNRDRSRSFRAIQEQADRDTPDTEFGGDAIPFPSKMGRQYPNEPNQSSLIRMILQAIEGR